MIDRSSFGDMTAIVYRLRRANGRTDRQVKWATLNFASSEESVGH